ncbi:RDD family protein, partial [Aetokthonos hydrillicola]
MVTTAKSTKYANFFKRFVAILIDGIVLIIFDFVAFGRPNETVNSQAAVVYNILIIICNWLYFAIMESSRLQSTLGKSLLGITVTNTHGNRISFGQATARYFAKVLWFLIFIVGVLIAVIGQSTGGEGSPYLIVGGLLIIISFLTLIVGYIMALFTPEKQALHDII